MTTSVPSVFQKTSRYFNDQLDIGSKKVIKITYPKFCIIRDNTQSLLINVGLHNISVADNRCLSFSFKISPIQSVIHGVNVVLVLASGESIF